MKQYGFVGKGTGKLGASVFAISGGEQIVRQYNPVVSNPNTEAQIAQRAKLKLMSQLGAALAPALGFAKQGLVSARNQFVSKNIGLCDYSGNAATCALAEIQLTDSRISLPIIEDLGYSEGKIRVRLDADASGVAKRVMYVVYKQSEDNTLAYVASKIVTEAGADGQFPVEFTAPIGSYVVYAYGIKDNSASATMRYENYMADVQGDEAMLSVIQLFKTGDFTFTETKGVLVQAS